MMPLQNVTLLGATGSIGDSTLNVLRRHTDRYRVFALTAHSQIKKMVQLCQQFQPVYAVVSDESSMRFLRKELAVLSPNTEVLSGIDALTQVASLPDVDIVVAAIVGAAGLLPNLAAVKAGKKILLANKESLVMSGQLFMDAVHQHQATLLPIDSEHNAILQALPHDYAQNHRHPDIHRLLLTASGGPFRNTPLQELDHVTPEQACQHPNWSMGRKISVDSATMLNKALELVEACWLFNMPPDKIDIVLHPQSIVHSLVDYVDGSMLAQMSYPDMRIPIACALSWPQRIHSGVAHLDLTALGELHFEAPCPTRFPILKLIRQVIQRQGTTTAILNAANEVAVSAFLQKTIAFTQIISVIEHTLQAVSIQSADHIDYIIQADQDARVCANHYIQRIQI